MSRLCYGYTIRDGRLEIQENEAENIRKIFKNYLAGNALIKSAELAGSQKNNSSVKRILTNKKYLGNEIYPKIIDRESFEKAGQILKERAVAMGRVWEKEEKIIKVPCKFRYREEGVLPLDPFERASYKYRLIEVVDDE
ncbi:recombinase family protein [Anaerococcus hydrogenalis]|uniref:Integrase n=1 Tax=Anaerococcus hydrogenalis TaxID=33029 RepID=A0A2N6UJA6_9FIRM|nr:recombinase family protein [Anaerococcus hydrogenalis]MDK7695220.1 integrase [Anaerococcus hydrogenalis]MDK7696805.1 integrase [Anaerococcus hydrogenalis]MDK7708247.1 integrase [Anaerococcus hydrogenalis]PMC81805.1 integrase [Anaerococcus hydrogenalis]